jgi:hypothetical protein
LRVGRGRQRENACDEENGSAGKHCGPPGEAWAGVAILSWVWERSE